MQENKKFELSNHEDGQKYIIQDLNPLFISLGYSNINKFKIEINSNKQEIYATGCNSSYTEITERINIGGNYNHYYPKIYHKKMTQITILSQVLRSNGEPEALFITYSYNSIRFEPSDKENRSYSFEEIKKIWSNYTLITKESVFHIDNTLTPTFIVVNLNNENLDDLIDQTSGNNYITPQNELVYLIYPNKYSANCTMYNFVTEYKNTYI